MFFSQLWGEIRKGKPEFPCPYGAAFLVPLHPYTELVTPLSFNLEAFTEKAVCGKVGKCIILPDSKCTLKADGLERPPGGKSFGEFGPKIKAEASEKEWLGLPASPVESLKSILILSLVDNQPTGQFPLFPLVHNCKVFPEGTMGAGLQLTSAEKFAIGLKISCAKYYLLGIPHPLVVLKRIFYSLLTPIKVPASVMSASPGNLPAIRSPVEAWLKQEIHQFEHH